MLGHRILYKFRRTCYWMSSQGQHGRPWNGWYKKGRKRKRLLGKLCVGRAGMPSLKSSGFLSAHYPRAQWPPLSLSQSVSHCDLTTAQCVPFPGQDLSSLDVSIFRHFDLMDIVTHGFLFCFSFSVYLQATKWWQLITQRWLRPRSCQRRPASSSKRIRYDDDDDEECGRNFYPVVCVELMFA